ncbi:hypothetical protein AMTRI_Chr01g132120 [Amborella trichopoda]
MIDDSGFNNSERMESNVSVSGEISNGNMCDSTDLEAVEDFEGNEHISPNNENMNTGENNKNKQESTDKKGVDISAGKAIINCEVRRNIEPFEGMVFESEEAVRTFYNEYALQMGFGIRNSVNRRKNGENISRYFVCSKEGHRERKHLMSEQPRPHTREGCKALIYAKKVESGQWIIRKFVKDHSHPMVSPNNVVLLRSHRRAANREKNFISTFDKEQSIHVEEKSRELNVQVRDNNSSREPLTLRYNDLREHALKVAAEGATTAGSYRIAMRGIQKVLHEVIMAKVKMITLIGGVQGGNTSDESQPASTLENVNFDDPQQTMTRDCTPTTRLNLGWENSSKRRKTCVNCKKQGHDKRTCSYSDSRGTTSDNVTCVPTSAVPENEFVHSTQVSIDGQQRFELGGYAER